MPTAISDFTITEIDDDVIRRLNTASRQTKVVRTANQLEVAVYPDVRPVENEWRALQAADGLSLHQSLDWCLAWIEAMRPDLAIVVGHMGADLAFILPLEIVAGRAGRIARFVGAPYSNVNTGLFSNAFAAAATPKAMKVVARAIAAALSGRADVVQLTNMPAIWRGTSNPFALLPSVENQNHAFQLPLLATFEETLAQVNAKRKRKRFRNSTRKLEALGGYQHVVAQSGEEKRTLLRLFFAQKAARFEEFGLPDVFKDRWVQTFFENAATLSSDDQDYSLRLHAIQLHDGGVPAIAGLSRKGDHVICQFGSIDESLAPDTSPGELLFYLMIEQVNAEGAALFDFGIGDQAYKRSWCPVETVQRDVLLPVNLRGYFSVMMLAGTTRLKSFVKGNPAVYAAVQKMRARKVAAPAEENDES